VKRGVLVELLEEILEEVMDNEETQGEILGMIGEEEILEMETLETIGALLLEEIILEVHEDENRNNKE